MTDQTQTPAGQDTATQAGDASGPSARRRALVRAASAVPVILTLHSGAVLARTSNLISTTSGVPNAGPVNCLDVGSGSIEQVPDTNNVYDLGTDLSTVEVYQLDPRVNYQKEGYSGTPLSVEQLCTQGGRIRKPSGEWVEIAPGSGFVSATALSSFAQIIPKNDLI